MLRNNRNYNLLDILILEKQKRAEPARFLKFMIK